MTIVNLADCRTINSSSDEKRVITVNGHELYVKNGWNNNTEEYESGPICYYFVDDNNCLSATLAFGSEYTSDEDVDAFAQYVLEGLKLLNNILQRRNHLWDSLRNLKSLYHEEM